MSSAVSPRVRQLEREIIAHKGELRRHRQSIQEKRAEIARLMQAAGFSIVDRKGDPQWRSRLARPTDRSPS